ncbi:thioredoxin family protein [Methylotenera versatilis]|uniref:thioredoxin family protein n=1 Tax=Methylotenera versatilis TaxID=1055487 RepID=UPI000647537C|nr:thioredoxin family protein [Methylotenera versatilis]
MTTSPISEPTREEINQLTGAVMLEFGAEWCEYCQVAQDIISSELVLHHNIRHIKIEDGKGRVLGRTFTVKLWPTLIFMKNGVELKRLVRQFNPEEIESALNLID